MFPNWTLRWIDTLNFAVGSCIAGTMVGRVKIMVVMCVVNHLNSNIDVLDHKTIIWQLFGIFLYNPVFVVGSEVSCISAQVRVRLRAVRTLLTHFHRSLAKWDVITRLRIVSSVLSLLIPLQAGWFPETAAPRFALSRKGSYDSHRNSHILLHTFPKCWIAQSSSTSPGSRRAYRICIHLILAIVCTLTWLFHTHCLIEGFHMLLNSYITWSVHSP